MIVAPSILSADFNKLLEEVKECNNAEFIHIDVMDGHFVPNISFGPAVYKNLKGKVNNVFDVHLMISDPMKYLDDHVNAGADIYTFHYEAVNDVREMIEEIKKRNIKVGISIKPKTDVKLLLPYLKDLDLVLVMSVEPGFGGQTFIDSALGKIEELARLKKENNYHYLIEVDGGINQETAKLVAKVGCEVVVAGTYIFKSQDRKKTIEYLKSL